MAEKDEWQGGDMNKKFTVKNVASGKKAYIYQCLNALIAEKNLWKMDIISTHYIDICHDMKTKDMKGLHIFDSENWCA